MSTLPELLTVTLTMKYCPSTSDPQGWNAENRDLLQAQLHDQLAAPDGIPFFKGLLCAWRIHSKVESNWGDCYSLIAGDGVEVVGASDGSEDDCEDIHMCPHCGGEL